MSKLFDTHLRELINIKPIKLVKKKNKKLVTSSIFIASAITNLFSLSSIMPLARSFSQPLK